jgi:hypothetical protein
MRMKHVESSFELSDENIGHGYRSLDNFEARTAAMVIEVWTSLRLEQRPWV